MFVPAAGSSLVVVLECTDEPESSSPCADSVRSTWVMSTFELGLRIPLGLTGITPEPGVPFFLSCRPFVCGDSRSLRERRG